MAHSKVASLTFFLVNICAFSAIYAAGKTAKPNILFIFADDLGWKDVGYQGSATCETPNIDQLAREGLVFSTAYAGGANCMPSRACLISGQYTPRHQVYAVRDTDRGDKKLQRVVPIPNSAGLPKSFFTMAEALKASGYATGHFGKWHLSGGPGATPLEQGFDESSDSAGHAKEGGGKAKKKFGNESDPKGVFTLAKKACDFMDRNKDKPFFCFLAHHAIHVPQQARPSTLQKFREKSKGKAHGNPMYAACTYDFDDSVGLVLRKLKELGLEDNTLLVFSSDNGGTSESSQEPLRGNKGSLYEGGIRVPLIVRWPGHTKPGISHVPVINLDLYPTFLDVATSTPPVEAKGLDGVSIVPLLKGMGQLKRQSIFWHFPGYLDSPVTRGREVDVGAGFRSRPVSVIRKGDWKLHLYHEEWFLDGGRDKLAGNHAVELYNLGDDVGERKDLAQANAAKRDELLDDLLAWIKATGARMADKPNPGYNPHASREKRKPIKAGDGEEE